MDAATGIDQTKSPRHLHSINHTLVSDIGARSGKVALLWRTVENDCHQNHGHMKTTMWRAHRKGASSIMLVLVLQQYSVQQATGQSSGTLLHGTVFGDNAGGCWAGERCGGVCGAQASNGCTANPELGGFEHVFDGDTTTYMDVNEQNGNFGSAGIALASAQPVTSIRFWPRNGSPGRMVQGVFQGSTVSETEGYETMYEITSEPAEGQWTVVDVPANMQGPYQWLRYVAPTLGYGNVMEVEFYSVPLAIDCVETTADASTCTAVGQELYTLTTPAANGGAACTGSSTLCVAGDGTIPRDCVEVTLHPNYCTHIGQELYTLTTPSANGGAPCTGSSTLCVAGDGTIPRDCVEAIADASTCTQIGQELYTLTTPAANGGATCTGSSTLCVAGDGSIPGPIVCEICPECATPTPAPCPAGSSGRRRQLQPVEAAQSLVPFLVPVLAVIGIVACFQ